MNLDNVTRLPTTANATLSRCWLLNAPLVTTKTGLTGTSEKLVAGGFSVEHTGAAGDGQRWMLPSQRGSRLVARAGSMSVHGGKGGSAGDAGGFGGPGPATCTVRGLCSRYSHTRGAPHLAVRVSVCDRSTC